MKVKVTSLAHYVYDQREMIALVAMVAALMLGAAGIGTAVAAA